MAFRILAEKQMGTTENQEGECSLIAAKRCCTRLYKTRLERMSDGALDGRLLSWLAGFEPLDHLCRVAAHLLQRAGASGGG